MATDVDGPRPTLLLIAGFGDNASLFDGLLATELAEAFHLIPLDLPGFGRPADLGETTLASLAQVVVEAARATGARGIIAHSVASIVASLAARQPHCPLETIVSLEGNLTAQDAYFSGTAADYPDAMTFREAFLQRLDKMAATAPEIARYRAQVAQADPRALWELGCDARRFSTNHHPGEVLLSAAEAVYLYNPANCPDTSLAWLERAPLPRLILDNASHWKSVTQPVVLGGKLQQALEQVGWGSTRV